ncbi:MAG TPA: amidohydrolase family protein [Myxococcaceae bacterium]|nr:amidohydrolase family protein [Myxococcaceae bacterium]
MEGRLLLKNCSIFRADGRIRDHMAVLVQDGKIAQVAPDADLPVLPGDWEVACRGRLVAPGLVDCHTHLVGGQLLPISGEYFLRSPRARFEAQQKVDARLTAQDVEVLASFAMAKALRDGVTLVVEHLHAPADVAGALAAEVRAARRLGIRLSISHATTSLNGAQAAADQVDANAAFCEAHKKDPLIRPALGFHGSFCAEDDLLRRLGRLREEMGIGLHYHLAESEDDLISTYSSYGKRIVPRLEQFGLLGPGVVAAYARAVDRNESERLMRSRTLVALGPRLSLAAEPGGGGFESVVGYQNLVGLGTTGNGSLWDELQAAFLGVMQIARVGRLLDPDGLMSQLLVNGPAELCSMLYGPPSGNVEVGSLADLVVYDLLPAPENVGGLAPHLLMQLGRSRVAWTIVGGRVCVREGQLLGSDYTELAGEAAQVLRSIWARSGRS